MCHQDCLATSYVDHSTASFLFPLLAFSFHATPIILTRNFANMPSELLHFPPAYTLVGLYRLLTDPSIRTPVLDKVRHASIRGAVVALLYAASSWRILDWFIRRFLIGGGGFFGLGRGKVGEAVKESVGGLVTVGLGRFSFQVDLVFCKHPFSLTDRPARVGC